MERIQGVSQADKRNIVRKMFGPTLGKPIGRHEVRGELIPRGER